MSSESDFDDNSEITLSDPLKVHRQLVSLSLEQIQESVGGNLLELVNLFMLEIEAATAIVSRDQGPMVQTCGVFQGSCRLKLKFMPPFFPQDPVLVFLD